MSLRSGRNYARVYELQDGVTAEQQPDVEDQPSPLQQQQPTQPLDTRSHVSRTTTRRSHTSSTSSGATKAYAKAQAARATLAYVVKEANVMKKKAELDASLHILQSQKAVAAAEAEFSAYEEAELQSGEFSRESPIEGYDTSKALQEVKLTVVGNNECSSAHGTTVTENFVCARPAADDEDDEIYEGDLGGPLIVQCGTSWIQFGIVSFGSSWANATTRGYTRVSEYQERITDDIRVYDRTHQSEFVSFNMGGVYSDSNFTCPTHAPLTDDRCGDSIFDSGESAISFSHFTHLAAMCSLALYLWVFG